MRDRRRSFLISLNFCQTFDLPEFHQIPKGGHIINYSKAKNTVRPPMLGYSTTQFVNVLAVTDLLVGSLCVPLSAVHDGLCSPKKIMQIRLRVD